MDAVRTTSIRARQAAVMCAVAFVLCVTVASGHAEGGFPRLANIYFPSLGTADLETLSKWDVLVLPKRAQELHQNELETLRALNPDIVLLVHMPLGYNGAWESPVVNKDLTDKLNACDWWMRDTGSGKVMINTRDGLLNVTTNSTPDQNGDRLCEWLPEFIAERMGPGGYWDGVYLDFCMDWIDWLNRYISYPIDSDGDGVRDDRAVLDAAWREGTEIVVSRLRQLVGEDYVIATNGNNTHYAYCDGSTRENFPNMHGDWYENIVNPKYGYLTIDARYRKPSSNIINAIWWGTATEDAPVWTSECERTLRFTLASALVFGDGYFSFDGPSHCQTWWHEYYDIELGDAVGRCVEATAMPGGRFGVEHADMIRLRRFENGLAVVNPTECSQDISLGGTYYELASWNGAFYEAAGARTTVSLGAESGEVFAGNGRMLLEVGGLTAQDVGGATVLTWNPVDAATTYSVYRAEAGSEESDRASEFRGVVKGTSYCDASLGSLGARYMVAAIDQGGCEGQLSCPVEVSSGLGSDLSLALMAVHEPDGTLALTWNPDGFPAGVVFDLVRTDESGRCIRLTAAAIDPRRSWRWVDYSVVPGASYLYEAVARVDGVDVTLGSAAVSASDSGPRTSSVKGCYPHPMRNSATIDFEVAANERGHDAVSTTLTIYDTAGRVVRRLVDGRLPPGLHSVAWKGVNDSGESVASGCYLYVLGIGDDTFSGKLLVVR
jgi:hypothetical protein